MYRHAPHSRSRVRPCAPHRVPAYACSCKHPSLTHLHGTSPVILPKKIHAPRHAPEPIRVDASWTLCPHRVSGSIIVAGIVARINAPFHTTARAISPPPSHHDHRHGARHGGGLRSRHMGLQSTLCQRGCPCNPASHPCLAWPRSASRVGLATCSWVWQGIAGMATCGWVWLVMASHSSPLSRHFHAASTPPLSHPFPHKPSSINSPHLRPQNRESTVSRPICEVKHGID